MMKMLTRAETAEFLRQGDRYLILTHRNPDGDTLGSAAALCRGLRTMGKTAFILENPELTEKLAFLTAGLTKNAPEAEDTVICVDISAPSMLPEAWKPLIPRIELRIDHHSVDTPFTSRALVEPGTAACGEIVWGLLTELGIKMDADMADAVYTAVSTDTGRFCFANTTADTFRAATACVECGCHLFRLNQDLFKTHTLSKLRLHGYLAEHTQFLKNGEMAVCTVPLRLMEELKLTEDDLDNISGFPRSIAGVKMSAVLREKADGTVRVSLRAMPGYDCAALCALFGGGGHKGAAGATIRDTLENAASAVGNAMEKAEYQWTEL